MVPQSARTLRGSGHAALALVLPAERGLASARGGRPQRRFAPAQLVERDRPGHRDVQRLGAADCGIDACTSQRASTSAGSPSRSAPRTKTTSPSSSSFVQRRAATRDERDAPPGRLVERRERHAEERAHRRAQRLRAGRVGAAGRERDAGAERIRRAEQRPDVARIGDMPERERHRPHAARQVVAPVDADHARRVRERRHLGEQRRLDVLARRRAGRPARCRRRPRRDPHPPRRTARACLASAGRGACGRA